MLTLFFTPEQVYDWDTAAASDRDAFASYFRSMLDAGIIIAPSQFEAVFVSAAHTDEDIEYFVSSARKALEA